MPVNSEIFRIYRHLFYGSPLQYKPTDNLQVSFIVNNLFDKKYYLNVNNRTYGVNNFLGDPRNFTLKLNYQY